MLINGQRIANKSGGAVDQLKRTSAGTVERIEIVDAASLGIAGLSGQVANVVLKAEGKAVGPVRMGPEFPRPLREARVLAGSISYSGKKGPVDYTFSASNELRPRRPRRPGRDLRPQRRCSPRRRHEVYHSRI